MSKTGREAPSSAASTMTAKSAKGKGGSRGGVRRPSVPDFKFVT
jgi:hypothetical protein